MVDQELSGGAPWSFHLANAILFAANVGLVFALARRWTGRNGIAMATALLWAFHPARVESVAWIAERKDVLSGLFFLAGLWFYTVGRRPGGRFGSVVGRTSVSGGFSPSAEGGPRSTHDLSPSTFNLRPSALVFLSWLCMLLGGMVKQIVIVMPFALTLLDVWPLGRTDWNRIWKDVWRLTAEKWAFWTLAVAFACLPIWAHLAESALLDVPLGHRLAMIPIHYLFYLQKLVWPSALAPLQNDLLFTAWQLAAGLVLLAGAAALAWVFRVRAPWALWGWLWFVGLLFPLCGVVWAGTERIAVRWLYVPQIGLTLAVVLGLAALARKCNVRRGFMGALLALALLVYGDVTLRALMHWRDPDSFGLWIWECHPEQGAACAIGGDVFVAQGEWKRAMEAYEKGVALGDKSCFLRLAMLWNHLGREERTTAAWAEFERKLGQPLQQFAAWERAPERELFWRVRGQALRAQGDYAGAIAALKEAVRWEPDAGAFVVAEFLRACHEGGRPEEGAAVAGRLAAATGISVREWRDLFPFYVQVWKTGARGYAYAYFAEYAERFPDDAVNLNYMAWLLATAPPDGLDHARANEWPKAAVRWAEQALAKGDDCQVGVWNVLAAARANAGDSTGAVRAAEKARDLARDNKDDALAADMEKRIASYRLGLAWRE